MTFDLISVHFTSDSSLILHPLLPLPSSLSTSPLALPNKILLPATQAKVRRLWGIEVGTVSACPPCAGRVLVGEIVGRGLGHCGPVGVREIRQSGKEGKGETCCCCCLVCLLDLVVGGVCSVAERWVSIVVGITWGDGGREEMYCTCDCWCRIVCFVVVIVDVDKEERKKAARKVYVLLRAALLTLSCFYTSHC
jgi:hypothetical protein